MLASAAIKIGAYARGLRYLEIEARNDHLCKIRMKKDSPAVYDITLTGDSFPASANQNEEKDSTIPLVKWNDLANGALPPLTSELVDFSMEIYAKLGDADALQVCSTNHMGN